MRKRTGVEPQSLPIVVAVDAYYELLERLVLPKVYSGLAKLYLLNTGSAAALDMSQCELDDAVKNLTNLRVTNGIDTCYLNYMIRQNILNYIDTLGVVIRGRLDYAKTLHTVHDDWINTDRKRRSLYFPSAGTVTKLMDLLDRADVWDTTGRSIVNTIGPIAESIASEANMVIGSDGTSSESANCSDAVKAFLDGTSTVLRGPVDMGFRVKHLPILRIYLTLAKLLTGSVDVNIRQTAISAPIALRKGLCLSDSTLAAFPCPTVDVLQSFAEPEVGDLSNKGMRYLSALDRYYKARVI